MESARQIAGCAVGVLGRAQWARWQVAIKSTEMGLPDVIVDVTASNGTTERVVFHPRADEEEPDETWIAMEIGRAMGRILATPSAIRVAREVSDG